MSDLFRNPLFDVLLRPNPIFGGFPELLSAQQQAGGDVSSNTDGFEATGSQTFELSHTTDDYDTGTGCIKVLNTYAGANNVVIIPTYASGNRYWPVTVGNTYTLTGRVKSDNQGSADCRARIRWYNSGKTFLSNSDGTTTNSPTSWTTKTSTATAPANTAYAQLYFMATKSENHYFLGDTFSFKRSA